MIEHSASPQDTLSEKQQLLLSRYHDGECSWIANLKAKRLLATRSDAQRFVAELAELSHHCADFAQQPEGAAVDLWDRIEARLVQEQRAALYLGARRIEDRSGLLGQSVWSRVSARHALLGGFSGAAIAATLLVVVSRPSQLVTFTAPSAGPASHNQLVQPVGIGNTAVTPRNPSPSAIRPFHSLEVDWMRANGSLKLIPDPTGSSAIIWVRRRNAAPTTRRVTPRTSDSRLQPTPLGLAPQGRQSSRTYQQYPLDAARVIDAK